MLILGGCEFLVSVSSCGALRNPRNNNRIVMAIVTADDAPSNNEPFMIINIQGDSYVLQFAYITYATGNVPIYSRISNASLVWSNWVQLGG